MEKLELAAEEINQALETAYLEDNELLDIANEFPKTYWNPVIGDMQVEPPEAEGDF